jgi:cytochrome c-type biogenesis protein CcsB
MVVVCLTLQFRRQIPVLAAGTALLAVLTLAYASTFETKIEPLMPALRSNWLTFHVFTCFLGYGAVTIAALAGAGYLITSWRGNPARLELARAFEDMTDKTISFGFLFLTIGIISGAAWTNSAWGPYWSWDPKETWSLITWFVYAVYPHCRYLRGWRGKRPPWISVIGFASLRISRAAL